MLLLLVEFAFTVGLKRFMQIFAMPVDSVRSELLRLSPQIRPPPLDLDILSAICAFLTDYPDLMSLSLTCSVFRPLAIRTMLRTRPIVLKTVDTILKFHDFVFSDAAARIPHILALVIEEAYDETQPDPERSERAIEALIAILRHAPCLMSLQLSSATGGQLLGYLHDRRVSAAIGEVVSLRELTIKGQMEATDFIGAVRSPLTKLTLCFLLNPTGGSLDWSSTFISTTLSHFKDSLESLSIEGSGVRLECSSLGSPAPTFTQFNNVRSLTLNELVALPHLSILLELFPNLDGNVHLTGFACYRVAGPGSTQNECYNIFKRVREENGRAQKRRWWMRIKRLICDAETLFVLNLQCPIGLTIVHNCAVEPLSVWRRFLV